MVSLDAPVGTTDVDLGSLIAATTGHPFDEIDDGVLASLLGALDPRERHVLTLRLGLDGGEPRTRVEIARRLSVPRREVRRLEASALRKLRMVPGVTFLAAA